jgi:integrase
MTDTTTKVTTWGNALDYTFKTRHTWRHGNGRGTAVINTGHFTRLRGRSFPVARINQACLSQVCIELEEECKSDATINRIVSAVSTVLNHCAMDGLLSQAPKLRRRKEVEHRLTWFSKDEVEAMVYGSLDPFDRRDLAELVVVAGYTGMRQAELLTLKAMDVDLSLNIIHVGGRPGFTAKAGNYRAIPIHDRIKDVLYSRMEHVSDNVRLFGDEWNNKDQLFRAFKKVRNYIGKDETYVFHSLRHSFGTWCAEAGVPMRTLMDLMGHKRIETTLRYAKTTDKARTDAINLI